MARTLYITQTSGLSLEYIMARTMDIIQTVGLSLEYNGQDYGHNSDCWTESRVLWPGPQTVEYYSKDHAYYPEYLLT